MTKKLQIIWVLCQIGSIHLKNSIKSCTYSNNAVEFVCSNEKKDDSIFFKSTEYEDCPPKDRSKLRFERMEVATVNFQDCNRPELPYNLTNVYKGVQFLDISNMSLTEDIDLLKMEKLTTLLASHNSLSITLPKLSNSIVNLDLSNNLIKSIDCVNYTNLKVFNSSFNKINSLCTDLLTTAPNVEFLILSHNKIDGISNNFFTNSNRIHEIDFSFNEIKSIDPNEFQGEMLEIIRLNNNKISKLSEKAFDECVNLKRIFLSNNEMTSISPELFKKLSKLNELDLSSNNIKLIDYHIFSANSELEVLNLAKIALSTLDERLFDNSSKMLHLDASNNRIQSLADDTFEKLGNLEFLNLSFNDLNHVTKKTFISLKKLKFIYLARTYITTIPQQTFSSQTKLVELDLSDNRIASLNADIFPTKMSDFRNLTINNCRMNELKGFKKTSFPSLKIIGLGDNNAFNCSALDDLSMEFVLEDNHRDNCSGGKWNRDKVVIVCLSVVIVILVLVILGGIGWYKLRQRRIIPGFSLSHDYRINYTANQRTATVKSIRPPKTTITEENQYNYISGEYDHLRF